MGVSAGSCLHPPPQVGPMGKPLSSRGDGRLGSSVALAFGAAPAKAPSCPRALVHADALPGAP